jgi:serine/threonine protein kinase
MARNLNHPNIVKFIAGFKQDGKRYLLFQWVDGGNLRELWEKHNPLLEREESILWALRQIHALSGALEQWHNYHQDSQKNCRHGDLKPENLLRTLQPAPLGILQIADLGLAKVHSLPTHVRTTPSGGFSGTLRYQAPEIVTSVSGKISRSYDMWSMGCILLEFIIWLLYGQAELQRFNLSFSDSFFVCEDGVVRLQDSVQRWIDHISETILSQSSTGCLSRALKELFTFVVGRLLVEDPEIRSEISNGHLVSLPTEDSLATQPVTITLPILPASSCNGPRRAKIAELYSEIHNILLGTSTSYFYDPVFSMDDARRNGPRKPLPGLFETERLGLPHGGQRNRSTGAGQSSTLVFANTNNPYGTVSLSNSWDIITENEFAKKVFRALPCTFTDEIIPKAGTTRALCDRCSSNDKGIFSRQFSVTLHHLEGSRRFCGLCQVLYEHMIASPPEGQETPTYFRVGSSLKRNITGPPLFSIVAGPGLHRLLRMLLS